MSERITDVAVTEVLHLWDGLMTGFVETGDGRTLLFDICEESDPLADDERRYDLYESWLVKPHEVAGVVVEWTIGMADPVGWCMERDLRETEPR